MAVFLPNSTQYKNYLYKEVVQRLDSPIIYQTEKERYWGNDPNRNMHRTLADLPLGLDVLESWFDNADNVGMADEYDLYSDDIKLVELEGLGFGKFYACAFARAINWTWGEITKYKTAQDNGALVDSFNPVDAKLARLGKYFNKREHYTVLYGYAKRKLYGIFSQVGIATQDTTFKPLAATNQLTVRQICLDLKNYAYYALDKMELSSLSQLEISVDPQLYARLSDPYITQNNEERGTGLSFLTSIGIANIKVYNELKGANLNKYVVNDAGNGMYDATFNRIVFRSLAYIPERHVFPRKLFEPFQKSTLRYEQVAISASTGIIYRDLSQIWYLDYSNTVA